MQDEYIKSIILEGIDIDKDQLAYEAKLPLEEMLRIAESILKS